ncbi:MAG: hypothetical protein AB7G25_08315 [Sphingomonadaceae bacterium]
MIAQLDIRQERATRPVASAMAAFWAGFVQPSFFALALMAVVFVVAAGGVVLGVTPSAIAGPLGQYVPRAEDDAEGFATRDAYQLADPRTPAGTRPRLYVIGNSLIAQAFASAPALERDLRMVTDRDWNLYFMTTPLQGPLDEAALADYATSRHAGTVVLSLGFDRLYSDRDYLLRYYKMGRLGFRSEFADNLVSEYLDARPRRRTGIFLVDNRDFILRNATMTGLRMLAQQPAQQKIDIYVFRQTDIKLSTYSREILGSLRATYRHDGVAVKLLENTAAMLKERGNRIVFYQPTISEDLLKDPADRRRYEVHLANSVALAKRLGGHYCEAPAAAKPPPQAYRDYYHIDDSVWQEKLRVTLARCVAAANRERIPV